MSELLKPSQIDVRFAKNCILEYPSFVKVAGNNGWKEDETGCVMFISDEPIEYAKSLKEIAGLNNLVRTEKVVGLVKLEAVKEVKSFYAIKEVFFPDPELFEEAQKQWISFLPELRYAYEQQEDLTKYLMDNTWFLPKITF